MILRIAYKNLLHKPLYAGLCWLLIACSTAVLFILLSINRQAQEQLEKQIDGVDMVLGAKGSPMQLILSSVYNLDAPTGNIYLQDAQPFMQHPLIERAIPISLGDSYRGYRIIGTTPAYLERYQLKPAQGVLFHEPMETVIGATVAKRTGLRLGDTFAGTHGLGEQGHVHEEEKYIVKGILPATGLSVDNVILTPLESVWEIHGSKPQARIHEDDSPDAGHAHDHDGPSAADATHHDQDETNAERGNRNTATADDHDSHDTAGDVRPQPNPQITSVLIKFRSPLAQLQLPRMINENTSMQAAVPAIEINRLQSLLGSGTKILRVMGWLLAALAACSIFVMLVQGTHERRYELALLRSMGGSRGKLLALVLLEAAILGLAGIAGGWLLSRACGWLLQQEIFTKYHLNFSGAWTITAGELYTSGAILAACLLAALFPAVRAFRLNISKTLANA
ncbi:FtsX-like permease family protein [Chitinophaga lutea]